MKPKNYQSFLCTYQQLHDIAYYFTTGAKFVSVIDLHNLDPATKQIFERILPLAIELRPYVKQLWCHLEQENNESFLY